MSDWEDEAAFKAKIELLLGGSPVETIKRESGLREPDIQRFARKMSEMAQVGYPLMRINWDGVDQAMASVLQRHLQRRRGVNGLREDQALNELLSLAKTARKKHELRLWFAKWMENK